MERFFRTLKYNCIFINDFKDVKELKSAIDDYIEHYNYRRFYSSIGYKKPMNIYLNSMQNYEQIADWKMQKWETKLLFFCLDFSVQYRKLK